MFAKKLLLALLAISIILLFYGFKVNTMYAVMAVPFVIGLAAVYVMSPQVNWWYYSKYPMELDRKLQQMLSHQSTFYKSLSPENKNKFNTRLTMGMMAQEFMPMVMEDVPEDIKAVVAANIIHLTFGQENYLLEGFEKVVIYPTPFPSPQFPKQFHSSEIYPEDGVMMFSAEHLLKGFAQPNLYYNSGLHEAIQAYLHLHPNKNYPNLPDDIWQILEEISHFPEKGIKEWIGLEEVNPLAVAICHFLMFPEAFLQIAPKLFKEIKELLNF